MLGAGVIIGWLVGCVIGLVIADRIDERRHQRFMREIPHFVRTGKWS